MNEDEQELNSTLYPRFALSIVSNLSTFPFVPICSRPFKIFGGRVKGEQGKRCGSRKGGRGGMP